MLSRYLCTLFTFHKIRLPIWIFAPAASPILTAVLLPQSRHSANFIANTSALGCYLINIYFELLCILF